MAKLAVLASGNGSNFEALALAIRERPVSEGYRHDCSLLVYDRKAAFVAERAMRLGVSSRYVTYYKCEREEAEAEISKILIDAGIDFIALAGFMRISSPSFVSNWRGRLVNIHPSILPSFPGINAIERAYEAGSREFGVTIHYVDDGMDSGPIIAQESFNSGMGDSLSEIEERVHSIEHRLYPRVVLALLDSIEKSRE